MQSENLYNLINLTELEISNVNEISSNISRLTNLRRLIIKSSPNLTTLPDSISNLHNLCLLMTAFC